jgi:hypothetical protein
MAHHPASLPCPDMHSLTARVGRRAAQEASLMAHTFKSSYALSGLLRCGWRQPSVEQEANRLEASLAEATNMAFNQ